MSLRARKDLARRQVRARDGHGCLLCGRYDGSPLHLHRVVYGSEMGRYEEGNCVLLCLGDHDLVHSDKPTWQTLLQAYLAAVSHPGDHVGPLAALRRAHQVALG